MMSARLVIKDRGSGKTMWEEDGRNKGENGRMEKNTRGERRQDCRQYAVFTYRAANMPRSITVLVMNKKAA